MRTNLIETQLPIIDIKAKISSNHKSTQFEGDILTILYEFMSIIQNINHFSYPKNNSICLKFSFVFGIKRIKNNTINF